MSTFDFTVPEELSQVARLAEDFVRREIIPREQELDPAATELPKDQIAELQKKAREIGLWNLASPVEYGGAGLGAFEMAIVNGACAVHKYCFPRVGGGAFGYPPPSILYGGSKEQIAQYVIPTIEEGWHSFNAITEEGSGSDIARSITTTARRDGSDYIIHGRKMWVTHAREARYGVVYARTGEGRKGISAFIVDADAPGLTMNPIPMLRNVETNELLFEDVRLPKERLVGDEGQGFELLQQFVGSYRVHFAATSIAVAEELLWMATDYVKTRESFGRPFAQRQGVQFSLADAHIELKAAKWLTWEAAKLYEAGDPGYRVAASIAKLRATEAGFNVVDSMIQLHGALGVTREMPLEHWLRDLRCARIFEGPTDIHRFVVARDLLGSHALGR